jgi:hypothetical protein
MELKEMGCEDGSWLVAQDRVQWRILVLSVFTPWVLLLGTHCYYVIIIIIVVVPILRLQFVWNMAGFYIHISATETRENLVCN